MPHQRVAPAVKRLTTIALLTSALAVAPWSQPTASAEGTTCRGMAATHVGVPGENLVTTSGADVVVTNAARNVQTLGGDDTICVTRARLVDIVPGRGDDLIDTSGFRGVYVGADLGKEGVRGSSGNDTYLGGNHWDEVSVASGTATDRKDIDTGGHFDYLYVYGGYRGGVTATLGAGNDNYFVARPRADVDVDGGPDPDDMYTNCLACDTADFDLGQGTIVVDEQPAGSALGFEYFRVYSRGHMPRLITATGSDGPDHISITACHTVVNGAGGKDSLYAFPRASLCAGIGTEIFGGEGDDAVYGTASRDVLRGGAGDDYLYGRRGGDSLGGGAGRDRADGAEGRDVCRAEIRQNCER